MPALTRWFLKASLVYFVAALLVGLAQAGRLPLNLPAVVAVLGPEYFHFFMVGWVTQLIFGVVYWMFPKYTRERPYRSERLGWATFFLLNLGLLLRALAEPANALSPTTVWGWGLVASAFLQWLGGMAFVVNTWGRVKAR